VIAILGGLGAASFFAISTVASSRSTRMVASGVVVAWVALVGLVSAVPLVFLFGFPVSFTPRTLAWLALSGGGNVVGLLLGYKALRIGKVGLVAPIASTEGAIAALIAVAAGEPLSTSVAIVMAAIAVGVVLTALAPDVVTVLEPSPIGSPGIAVSSRRAILLAIAAAISFGVSLYSTGRVGAAVPVVWAVVPARLLGVLALTVPLAASRRLSIGRSVLPFVVVSGICEVAGFASFAVGARDSIAVSAILLSQFATISAVLARILFGERLSRLQLAGIAIVVIGVAILAALQA
jgi:drug/metabolite transporter (DMT)-like permease